MKRSPFIVSLSLLTLCLPAVCLLTGCFVDYAKSNKEVAEANGDAKLVLQGSWTNKDKTRFLEITKNGSVVVNKKGSSSEDIGFYEIKEGKLWIYKDRDSKEGRSEIVPFDLVSDNEVLFGENKEYWNVVTITGRWYREGTDIDKVIEQKKYEKLTDEEQHLVDIKKKKNNCEELIRKLQTDRKSYLIKLSRLDEKKDADSWKLNASMLSKTKLRIRDADYEMKKLKRAEEALEVLIADTERTKDMKDVGLDEEGLKKLLLSIGETEDKLPIKGDESEFELKSMVEEELKLLEKENQ